MIADAIVKLEGWTTEPVGEHHTMLRHPAGGMVTIDWSARVFRGGLSTCARAQSAGVYAGRGWCERLVSDAIAWLTGIYERRSKERS